MGPAAVPTAATRLIFRNEPDGFLPWHALSVSLPSRLKIPLVFDGAERRVSIQHCRLGTECGGLGVSLEQYFKAEPVSSTAVGRGIIIMTTIPEYSSLTIESRELAISNVEAETRGSEAMGNGYQVPGQPEARNHQPSILSFSEPSPGPLHFRIQPPVPWAIQGCFRRS